jgi:hypothetical protein
MRRVRGAAAAAALAPESRGTQARHGGVSGIHDDVGEAGAAGDGDKTGRLVQICSMRKWRAVMARLHRTYGPQLQVNKEERKESVIDLGR